MKGRGELKTTNSKEKEPYSSQENLNRREAIKRIAAASVGMFIGAVLPGCMPTYSGGYRDWGYSSFASRYSDASFYGSYGSHSYTSWDSYRSSSTYEAYQSSSWTPYSSYYGSYSSYR